MILNSQNIIITPNKASIFGADVSLEQTGEALLTELYHRYIEDYPKFFKMDTLSRLGFIGAELLLKYITTDECVAENCAIIFGNQSSSIKNDRDYLTTIQDEATYYPSPSLFVYTLPNIVTGEIAIRHKIYGETCFYVLENEQQLHEIALATLSTTNYQSAIVGWVECTEKNNFYANIKLLWKN